MYSTLTFPLKFFAGEGFLLLRFLFDGHDSFRQGVSTSLRPECVSSLTVVIRIKQPSPRNLRQSRGHVLCTQFLQLFDPVPTWNKHSLCIWWNHLTFIHHGYDLSQRRSFRAEIDRKITSGRCFLCSSRLFTCLSDQSSQLFRKWRTIFPHAWCVFAPPAAIVIFVR